MTGALLTLILAGIVTLALIAKRMRVPYPVVFVLGGLVVAMIPGVPEVELKPDLAVAHGNLGNALKATGRATEAIAAAIPGARLAVLDRVGYCHGWIQMSARDRPEGQDERN